jgi:hypothetical protein
MADKHKGWHKGQCQKCKVAYSWTGGPRLKDARCPKCGGGLSWVSWDEGGSWGYLHQTSQWATSHCICDPKRRSDQLRTNPHCKAKHA